MTSDESSKVVIGFLIGAGLGALAGLLLAPQSGKESQDWIAEQAKSGMNNLKTASQRVKETLQSATAQGRTQVADAVESGKQAYQQVVG